MRCEICGRSAGSNKVCALCERSFKINEGTTMAKPKKSTKSNKIPELLTHDNGVERSPEETTDCLFEVVAGTKSPETFGLTNREHAISLLPGCEGGVSALARAEAAWNAAEEESKRLAISEKNAALAESAVIEVSGDIDENDREKTERSFAMIDGEPVKLSPVDKDDLEADEENEDDDPAPLGKAAKPVVIGARGLPVKHPYQAKMRALGVVLMHGLKVKNLIKHAEDYNEIIAGWNVEGDGQKVHHAETLEQIGKNAIEALQFWHSAIGKLPDNYKPKHKAVGGSSTSGNSAEELPAGAKVVLREKFRAAYKSLLDPTQEFTVKTSAGSKVVLTSSVGLVSVSRRELKLASE